MLSIAHIIVWRATTVQHSFSTCIGTVVLVYRYHTTHPIIYTVHTDLLFFPTTIPLSSIPPTIHSSHLPPGGRGEGNLLYSIYLP